MKVDEARTAVLESLAYLRQPAQLRHALSKGVSSVMELDAKACSAASATNVVRIHGRSLCEYFLLGRFPVALERQIKDENGLEMGLQRKSYRKVT